MANPELGTKQICPNCQAKFYDLGRRPAHCPKCAHEFDPDEAVRNRRARAHHQGAGADGAEDQGVEKEPDDEEEEEEGAVTPELDEVVNDPTLAGETDDDDDAAEPAAVSEDLGEFTDEEDVEDDADVPFLEDEDDDDFDESEIEGLPDGDEDR